MWGCITQKISMCNFRQPKNDKELFYDTFKPIIDHHIKVILESGLLLDEDYEVLLETYDFATFPVKAKSRLNLKLIPSVVTLFFSVVIAKKCHLPVLVAPPAILILSLVYLQRSDASAKIKQKHIAGKVIKALMKVRKINISIIRYLKTRAEVQTKNKTEYFSIFNKNILEFIKVFTNESKILFDHIFNAIDYLTSITKQQEKLQELKEINLNELLVLETLSSTEDCIKQTNKIQDIFTLMVSTLLNTLGTALHSLTVTNESADKAEIIFNEISNIKLPALLSKLNSHTGTCQNEFSQLKYSASKKIELRQNPVGTCNKHISNKLQQTLMTSINNLSIIMERSHAVLSNVESIENAEDTKEFANAIKDLRNHAFATYESLDVLCRLYGILASSKVNDTNNEVKDVSSKKCSVNEPLKNVNYNENVEAVEENYELFINDDTSELMTDESLKYSDLDQSSEYLGLMLRELRQSLKQHDRFIAAKKRRGSESDDENTTSNDLLKSENRNPQPKFDLSLLNISAEARTHNVQSEKTIHDPKQTNEKTDPQRVLASPIPPPLPPPPPPFLSVSFVMDNLQDEKGSENSKTMLENIKSLSSQLEINEEVYGDSDSESSD